MLSIFQRIATRFPMKMKYSTAEPCKFPQLSKMIDSQLKEFQQGSPQQLFSIYKQQFEGIGWSMQEIPSLSQLELRKVTGAHTVEVIANGQIPMQLGEKQRKLLLGTYSQDKNDQQLDNIFNGITVAHKVNGSEKWMIAECYVSSDMLRYRGIKFMENYEEQKRNPNVKSTNELLIFNFEQKIQQAIRIQFQQLQIDHGFLLQVAECSNNYNNLLYVEWLKNLRQML